MEERPSLVPVKPVLTKVYPLVFVILDTLLYWISFRMDPRYLPVEMTEK